MARQLRLPVGRIQTGIRGLSDVVSLPEPHIAIMHIDTKALMRTKSFATIKAQSPDWSDQDAIDWLLAAMAEGPA